MTDSKVSVFIYYHTHWDREWYEPFCAFQVRLAEVVDEILERLDKGILPCFTLDGQTSLLADYLELRPENEGRLRRYIKNGQINIGPWYVMPDEFLVSGESLIRNLKRGIEESREWGCDEFTGYLPDTFGHSADMPLILNHFGIDSAVLWRGVNPETSEFIWKSRDGSQVLGYHLAEGYFQNMLHDPELSEEERVRALINLKEKTLAKSANNLVLLPLGGDHLGPLTKLGKQLLDRTILDYQSGHPVDYLKRLNLEGLALPKITGELMDNSTAFLLPGVWSSRMYLKQANRKLEYTIIPNLEQQIAMNQLLDPQGESQRLRYPKYELNKLWTVLLQNHPHDSICGCSVDAVHRENEVRFDSANQIANALKVRLNHQLAQSATEDEWVVVNPTDAPYTGIVEAVDLSDLDPDSLGNMKNASIDGGQKFVDRYRWNSQDVPQAHRKEKREARTSFWVNGLAPHSIQRISKKEAQVRCLEPVHSSFRKEKTEEIIIWENKWLRLEASQKNIRLIDRLTGRITCLDMGLRLVLEKGDSYNSGVDKSLIPLELFTFKNLEIKELSEIQNDGSAIDLKGGKVLEVFWHCPKDWGRSYDYLPMRMILTLFPDSPFLNVLFHGKSDFIQAHKWQLSFSTDSSLKALQCETHFGLEEREYNPRYGAREQMSVEPMKELRTNTGPIQRFIMGNGQLWVTKGLTEYEVMDNRLYLTLSRSFLALSDDQTGVRGAHAGPPFQISEGCLLGRDINAEFAWAPLSARKKGQSEASFAYEVAERFYKPVLAFSGELPASNSGEVSEKQASSLVQWDNREIVSSAIKCPDGYAEGERGLIVRLFNISDKAQKTVIQTGVDYKKAVEVDFMEAPTGVNLKKDKKGQAMLAFKAHEVKTVWFQVE